MLFTTLTVEGEPFQGMQFLKEITEFRDTLQFVPGLGAEAHVGCRPE